MMHHSSLPATGGGNGEERNTSRIEKFNPLRVSVSFFNPPQFSEIRIGNLLVSFFLILLDYRNMGKFYE